jgi:putative glycosyltransferase (TIGR04372 family)
MPKRFGEFALRGYLFLKRQEINGREKRASYIFISGPPVNRQLLDMFKRKLFIIESTNFIPLRIFPHWLLSKTRFLVATSQNSNEYYEFNYGKPLLKFTPDEEKRGRKFLKEKMGINLDKDCFVCVFARDSEYLKFLAPEKDASANDYRNSNIDMYKKAVEFIIEKGAYVIRMGYIVDKPMNFKHEKFIDYSVTCRDDFMDIYLAAHCKFFLSGTSGMTDIGTIFHVPKIGVDTVPVGYAPCGKNDIYIPKKIRNLNTGQLEPVKLIMQQLGNDPRILFDGNKFRELGYEYVNNTEEEILSVTKEMFERLDGTFKYSDNDKLLQEQYYKIFPDNHWAMQAKKVPIGRDFLRENSSLYTHTL